MQIVKDMGVHDHAACIAAFFKRCGLSEGDNE